MYVETPIICTAHTATGTPPPPKKPGGGGGRGRIPRYVQTSKYLIAPSTLCYPSTSHKMYMQQHDVYVVHIITVKSSMSNVEPVDEHIGKLKSLKIFLALDEKKVNTSITVEMYTSYNKIA